MRFIKWLVASSRVDDICSVARCHQLMTPAVLPDVTSWWHPQCCPMSPVDMTCSDVRSHDMSTGWNQLILSWYHMPSHGFILAPPDIWWFQSDFIWHHLTSADFSFWHFSPDVPKDPPWCLMATRRSQTFIDVSSSDLSQCSWRCTCPPRLPRSPQLSCRALPVC